MDKHWPECCAEEAARKAEAADSDWKVLQLDRCSYRVMQEVMYAILNTGARVQESLVVSLDAMLVKPDWTSAEVLVQIPRRMKSKSHAHASNIEFFSKIKGVVVKDPPRNYSTN